MAEKTISWRHDPDAAIADAKKESRNVLFDFLARSTIANERFADAEKRFMSVVEKYPDSEFAPEAFYWAARHRTQLPRDLSTKQLG